MKSNQCTSSWFGVADVDWAINVKSSPLHTTSDGLKLTIPRNRFFPLSTKAENSRKNSYLKEFKSILADVAPLHKKSTHVPSPWLKPVSLINMIIVYIFQQIWARFMVIKYEKLVRSNN